MLVHTRRALSVVVDLHTGVAFPCAAKARVPIIILRGFVVRLGKNLAPVIVDTMFGESRHVLPLKIFFVGFVVGWRELIFLLLRILAVVVLTSSLCRSFRTGHIDFLALRPTLLACGWFIGVMLTAFLSLLHRGFELTRPLLGR
ncbi:hypothetical protein KC323_g68 [Hortaea werneckii]|nr:hypothetical protein KC323_g68 [Hortaea werneckii]